MAEPEGGDSGKKGSLLKRLFTRGGGLKLFFSLAVIAAVGCALNVADLMMTGGVPFLSALNEVVVNDFIVDWAGGTYSEVWSRLSGAAMDLNVG